MTTFALTIDGVDVSDVTLMDVRVSLGRQDVWSDVEAGTFAATILHPRVGLNGTTVLGKQCILSANQLGRLFVLFTGWLTDITAASNTYGGVWEQSITAVGPLAELSKVEVLNYAWPVENDSQRIGRILQTVGRPVDLIPTGVTGPAIIASEPEGTTDWAADELANTARSGGGLLFEDHTTGTIGYQPSVMRYGGTALLWDISADTWDTIAGHWDSPGYLGLQHWRIPECSTLFEPFTWEQHTGDIIKHCEVTYGPAAETDRAIVTAGTLDPPVISEDIDTLLQDQPDAQALADRLVFVRSVPRWNAPKTVVRVDTLPDGDVLTLLDYLMPGRPVLLETLPPGSPYADFTGFLEGWEHRISADGDALVWECEVWLSDRALTAPMMRWDQATMSWDSVTDAWNDPIIGGVL